MSTSTITSVGEVVSATAVAAEPPVVSTHVFDTEPDGCTYTISEWRARFGAPGSHVDVHGRQLGAYATED